MTVDIFDEPDVHCKPNALVGNFGWFLQGLLATLAFLCLISKMSFNYYYICITIYNEKEILFIFQGRLLLKLSIKYTHVFTIFSCKYLQIVYFPKIKFLIHVYIISTCFLLCINITYIWCYIIKMRLKYFKGFTSCWISITYINFI